MIDTIRIYTDEYSVISAFDLNCLSNLKTNKTKLKTYYTGKLFNFFISYSETMLSIQGSLPKFYLGNNIQVMTKDEINKAIKKLEDVLDFSLDNFRISKLDIGATFEMDYSIHSYLDCLLYVPRYKITTYPGESKTFYTNQKALLIYDKIEESMKKKVSRNEVLKNGLEDKFMIRYELQIKKVSEVCGKTYVTDLKEDKFIKKILILWRNEFKKIKKEKKVLNFEEIDIDKPNDFFLFLAFGKIDDLGKEKTYRLLKKLEITGKIKPSSYYNIQSKIKDSKSKFSLTSKYIEELENKIDTFSNNYLNSKTLKRKII